MLNSNAFFLTKIGENKNKMYAIPTCHSDLCTKQKVKLVCLHTDLIFIFIHAWLCDENRGKKIFFFSFHFFVGEFTLYRFFYLVSYCLLFCVRDFFYFESMFKNCTSECRWTCWWYWALQFHSFSWFRRFLYFLRDIFLQYPPAMRLDCMDATAFKSWPNRTQKCLSTI